MIGLVIILGFIVAFGILFSLSYAPSKTYQETIEIQDFSSPAQILLNSSIQEVSFTLLPQDYYAEVEVLKSDSDPIMENETLPLESIPALEGPSRYNYNYLGGDLPMYLLKGSSLIYSVHVDASGKVREGETSAILYLFDNAYDYNFFRNYDPYDTVQSFEIDDRSQKVIFDATRSALYYVAIEIEDGFIIESNVTALKYVYNTSGYSSPSDCSEYLNINKPTCTIKICSKLYCSPRNIYFYFVSSSYTSVLVNYKSNTIKNFTNFCLSLTLASVVSIISTILFLCITVLIIKKKFC